MAKKIAGVDDTLANIQTPELGDSDLGEQLDEKKLRLAKIKGKLDLIIARADDI